MRYLNSILTRRALLNTDSYEKNKYIPKPFDFVGNGLFRQMMHRDLYDTEDVLLKRAISMLERPFLYLLDTIKRVSAIDNYMIQ